ncbi:hypothetical protein GQ44DRAFT_615290 [Phaeosphaeriaceae sp. PMI808]|nr:hypothetical protein GQ44DRAFT_615290 [Phaeosphaeriaceae sp. PMI808]
MHSPIFSQRDEVVGVIPTPPGITPNFTNPPSRAHVIITSNIVCTTISALFTVLRFYTNFFITRHLKVDDCKTSCYSYKRPLLTFIDLSFAAWVKLTRSLATHYGLGRHLWDIPFSIFNPIYIKLTAITITLYGISIMLTKLSILTFFIQFIPWGNLRLTIYITMVIIILYSLVGSFQWVYLCQPLEKYWDLTITGGSCINRLKMFIFTGVMNIATDAIILILPVLILRGARLPIKQKISIMIVLMTGGFVFFVSIIRLKLAVDMVYSKDFSWEGCTVGVWWVIETHVAIVCACLPAGKPFLRKHMPRVIRSSDGAAFVMPKLRTIRSTHTQRLPSGDAGDDP